MVKDIEMSMRKHARIGYNEIFTSVGKAYSLSFLSPISLSVRSPEKVVTIVWVPCVSTNNENKICMLFGRALSVSRTSNYYFTLPAALKLRFIQTVIPVDS